MKLLIVEDEKRLCQTIAKHLKAEGYTIDTCYNGSDAIDYIEGTEYDAIILDIMLPGIDGIAVLKKVRSKKLKTPVLLLTAKNTVEDKVTGLDIGADDYLTKEYSILEYLMHNKEIVLSREKIQQHIWNYDYEGGSNIIDVYIRTLRNKIDAKFDQKLIQTVRGLGYVIKSEE